MTESLDDVEDGATFACSEVPGTNARVVIAKVVECDEVTFCEVEDMYVVADGGTIVGGIVYS